MKPEKILQSNILDIVFENRNKDYGAYELRKNYSRRINKAVGFTASLVLLLALSQSFKVPVKKGSVVLEIPDAVKLTQVVLPKEVEQPKEKEQAKTVQQKAGSSLFHGWNDLSFFLQKKEEYRIKGIHKIHLFG